MKLLDKILSIFKFKCSQKEVSELHTDYGYIRIDTLTKEDKQKLSHYTQFTLSVVEAARYCKFIEDHKRCVGNKHCGTTISFNQTGIGTIIKCKCENCGKEIDITDYSNW